MSTGRWILFGAICVGLAAATIGRVPILERIGHGLVAEDPLEPADAIVVVSGSYPDRILEAAALYEDGLAPLILLFREREGAGFKRLRELGVRVPRGYELNRSIAEQLGVPGDAIAVVDEPPGSTFSEAARAIRYARMGGFRTLLVVTSRYHTRRAGRIYRHLAGGNPKIIMRAARDDSFRPEAWWRHRAMTRRVIIEYQKLLVFLLMDRWRGERIGDVDEPIAKEGSA